MPTPIWQSRHGLPHESIRIKFLFILSVTKGHFFRESTPLKIIFDQSAFHDHLDLLKSSRLPQLTQDGKITVYHTATFLDETLRMGDSAREKLKQQWPFFPIHLQRRLV